MPTNNIYSVFLAIATPLRFAANLLIKFLILPQIEALTHIVCQQSHRVPPAFSWPLLGILSTTVILRGSSFPWQEQYIREEFRYDPVVQEDAGADERT
jgi:hypothetical protein